VSSSLIYILRNSMNHRYRPLKALLVMMHTPIKFKSWDTERFIEYTKRKNPLFECIWKNKAYYVRMIHKSKITNFVKNHNAVAEDEYFRSSIYQINDQWFLELSNKRSGSINKIELDAEQLKQLIKIFSPNVIGELFHTLGK